MAEAPLNDHTLTLDTEAQSPERQSKGSAPRIVTNFQPSQEAVRLSNAVTRKTILERRAQNSH